MALNRIRHEPDLVVTEQAPLSSFRTEKMPVALAIVIGVLGLAVYGVPIIVTAIAGSVLMVLTGCLRMHELHESIRWDVIFLLAGVLPLGLAMETTGGAQLLADWAVRLTAGAAPLLLLYLFYGVAMLLTEIISNNATVVVLLPIALATAQSVGISPYPLVLCVMFAASTSFMTPVGYQTNAMIYGPGGYRFLDFFRVGAPLNLLLWGVTPYLIYTFQGL
ncbi:MAG: SLC13 family permease [Caldilineaceae bacterium]